MMEFKQLDFQSFQNESELFGRTIRVNLAKPMRIKEGSSRPGEWEQPQIPHHFLLFIPVHLEVGAECHSWWATVKDGSCWRWACATCVGNKRSLSFSG